MLDPREGFDRVIAEDMPTVSSGAASA